MIVAYKPTAYLSVILSNTIPITSNASNDQIPSGMFRGHNRKLYKNVLLYVYTVPFAYGVTLRSQERLNLII